MYLNCVIRIMLKKENRVFIQSHDEEFRGNLYKAQNVFIIFLCVTVYFINFRFFPYFNVCIVIMIRLNHMLQFLVEVSFLSPSPRAGALYRNHRASIE